MEDAESAAAAIRATAGRSSDWQRSKTYLHAFEINRGHPAKALGDTARPGEDEYTPHTALYERVLDAMYGDGDSVNGGQAARELAGLLGAAGLGRKRRASGRADRPVRRHALAAESWRARRRRSGHHASPLARAGRLARVAHHRHRVRGLARGEAGGRLRRRGRGGCAGSPGHPHAERARRTAERPARRVHPEPGVRPVHGRDQPRRLRGLRQPRGGAPARAPARPSGRARRGPAASRTPTTSPITWPRTCARRAAWPP